MALRRLTRVLHPAIFALLVLACTSAGAEDDPRLAYARELLARAGQEAHATVSVDPSITCSEGYRVHPESGGVRISGGGPAGVLYGVQEWLRSGSRRARLAGRPDFELRGTALFLMKDASYDYELTPGEFPWFYDRELLTQFLDYLFENRFNAIFLWSGHLFPSIVELPEYPDATSLSRDRLLRNQEQFAWLTRECARRNISVLVHFYQIHIPKALARSRGIAVQYNRPNEFVARFVRYSLARFLAAFPAVGLYVCPGEALATQYQPEWIRDVIFAAAKESGKDPMIVVRDWTLDAERFRQVCVGEYDNLYTELKHNVEMIVSPVPDPRHAYWRGVGLKHIVNLHEAADVKPFRWGSPTFVHEMVSEWRKAGIDGAEVYGMVSWRWPFALDRLEPTESGFWPPGPKLLTFERDAIWLAAVGRYLWRVDRDAAGEARYWTDYLAARFGTQRAADLLRRWYDTTGPILPGLQNLTHVRNMNFFPTAIGAEQAVDAILAADGQDYHVQPCDRWFLARYRERYRQPDLANRVPLSVSQYVTRLTAGECVTDAMTPDRVACLMSELASESLNLARAAQQSATRNHAEAERFVTDSEALVAITAAWRGKVDAAFHRGIAERTGSLAEYRATVRCAHEAAAAYERLVSLTDRTYVNPTDMLLSLNWHEGLERFRADLDLQREVLRRAVALDARGVYWLETEFMDGPWVFRSNYRGYSGTGFRVSLGPEQRGTVIERTVTLREAGRYAVWARGLLAGEQDRAFQVEVAGTVFPRSHGEPGPPEGRFTWVKVGALDLRAGPTRIAVHDAGSGYECPDVIALSADPTWAPE